MPAAEKSRCTGGPPGLSVFPVSLRQIFSEHSLLKQLIYYLHVAGLQYLLVLGVGTDAEGGDTDK